jgi:undecaprenyl-diphosphatase
MLTGVVAADLDHSIVKALNRWFADSGSRVDLAKALALWPLLAVIVLAGVAWVAGWGDESDRRVLLLLGLGGVALALVGNAVLGHLYYRPRPFVAMPELVRFLSHSKESSMYSDHLAVAGGLTTGILAARRWVLGSLAVAGSVLLAIGRIGAGLHYPSDCVIAVAASVVGFVVLLPARPLLRPLIRLVAKTERRMYSRGRA